MSVTLIVSLGAVGLLVVVLAVLLLRRVSLPSLMAGIVGAVVGLLLGALASEPLSKLPSPLGQTVPAVVSIALTLFVMSLAVARRQTLAGWLSPRRPAAPAPQVASAVVESPAPAADQAAPAPSEAPVPALPPILVDTSVIIDGRIADIATAGFVPGRLVVPRFVLAELQNIADSDDAMRRGRGRRGLDVLNTLRELPDVDVEIIEDDVPKIREVDAKLVALAQRFSCNVLTTDYNLNRVAQIQGVRVLNVNELSNAIRPVVLPGEELVVRVVQPGKERHQGVGYLADGTMIVVENGDKLMGQEVSTEVTRVFQTVAGKMIFATPRTPAGPPTTHSAPAAAPAAQPVSAAVSAATTEDPPHGESSSTPSNPTDNTHSNPRRSNNGRGNGQAHGLNPAQNGGNGNHPTASTPRNSSMADLESRLIAATNNEPKPQNESAPSNSRHRRHAR